MKTCLEEFFNGNFLQVLPSVPVPSSPLKQGEEVLLRKKKRFSPNFLQFWTILTIFFLQVQGSLLLPTCAWWWAGTEGISNTHNFILRSGFHNFTSLFQVDQNLDFMCEVEDGWWKGRVGGRVSWSLTFLMLSVFLINRLVFSPPTLSRCVKMTQLIRSNPVQKQSRNYPYRRRFENWSIVGKAVFISALLFRHLSSCRHHWRRGLWPRLWRRKTRKILSGQTGEQQFPWEG